MKYFLIPAIIFGTVLNAMDKHVDSDIWERFYNISARIEGNILDDHEYYIMSLQRAYGLQAIFNANDGLYLILKHQPVKEKELLSTGQRVLKELMKSQIRQQLILPAMKPKSNVTNYYFSSVN